MGMTMTQKILAAHAGLDAVTAGQLVEAKAGRCNGKRYYRSDGGAGISADGG